MTRTLGELFEQRGNNFNLLRVLAALAVIYGHATAITGHGPADIFLQYVGYKFIGGVAVDVFFVTSGFLVTASALSGKGLVYYVASRALRIYPALIACIALMVLVLGPLLTQAPDYWNGQTWRYFWRNASAFYTEYFLPGVFQQSHDKAVNGSLWSLVIEVRMYLILLAVAWLGVLRRTLWFNIFFVAALAAGMFAPQLLKPVLAEENHRHVGMMFLIGAFCWVHRHRIPLHPAMLGLVLVAGAVTRNTPAFGYVYALALPCLVFLAAFAPGLRWYDRMGDYSYGIYLYGWPAQQLALLAVPGSSNAVNTALGCLFAIALAIPSWHLVEKPALRLKARVAARLSGKPRRMQLVAAQE